MVQENEENFTKIFKHVVLTQKELKTIDITLH